MIRYFQCLKCRKIVGEGGCVEINKYLGAFEDKNFKENIENIKIMKTYICRSCYGIV